MARRLRTGAVVTLLVLGSTTAISIVRAPKAAGLTRGTVLSAAAAYGPQHGHYHVGIAVYDTVANHVYGSGYATGMFASESIVKVMIANRLLVQGRMYGATARRAYRMIVRSDDAIASSFYGSVGGDSLISWVKRRYKVWDLGTQPRFPGWWGNTHITPRGLVRYYAKLKRDRRVAPWLLNAMHHAKMYGSDGTYQYFGLPSATHGFAIKQGWGDDYDDGARSADFNTSGFVNNDRYAVAILARGPIGYYGHAIGSMLTHTARLLLPGGYFPEMRPRVRGLSMTSGRTAGGQRISVRGLALTHVRAVLFGGVAGTAVSVVNWSLLRVTTPPHATGSYPVRVVTTHGTSFAGTIRFRFVLPPQVTEVAPSAGSTAGETPVHISGLRFDGLTRVLFGTTPAAGLHLLSSTSLVAVAPPHAGGTVDIRVQTRYGTSPITTADHYTYAGRPVVTGLSPPSGAAAGGTVVTINGDNLGQATSVWFGATQVSELTVTSPTTLTVVAPAHAPGPVDVTVRSPGGTSAISAADRFTYTS